jgi:hypothetical protein
MARIEMRDVTIYVQDGLAGTANLSANSANAEATLNIETVVLNSTITDQVPVGARLYVGGETTNTVHTVTARPVLRSPP